MLENFKNLSNDNREKFLKICLLLFSDFKSATFKNNGIIIFKRKGLFNRRVRIQFMDLLTFGVPRSLSMNRWGSYSLVDDIYQEIKNIDNSTTDFISKIEKVINYLYSIFEETKIRDVYYNYDNVIVLKESLKDKLNKINIINNYNNISLGNVRTVLLNNFVHELRLNLATITLFISLWLPAKSYLLQDCAAQVRDGIFPWTLNHLS